MRARSMPQIPTPPANAVSSQQTERQLMEDMILRLSGLPEALRQTITDHQWSQIPLFIDEHVYGASQAANTSLQIRAQTSGLELITSIVASIPNGSTGLVQLGDLVIPISAGITVICPVQKILDTAALRSVSATVTGPMALWLTGQQLPTYGVLAQ